MRGFEFMAANGDRDARERRKRNIALALALFGLVALFYVMSIVRVHW
jgi:hypothetical protein